MISSFSRNKLAKVISVTNPVTGETTKPPYVDIRQRITEFAKDDRFLVIDESNRSWALLGLKTLQDPRAWWIIADLSGVVDAFDDFDYAVDNAKPLRIPSVNRYLFKIIR